MALNKISNLLVVILRPADVMMSFGVVGHCFICMLLALEQFFPDAADTCDPTVNSDYLVQIFLATCADIVPLRFSMFKLSLNSSSHRQHAARPVDFGPLTGSVEKESKVPNLRMVLA